MTTFTPIIEDIKRLSTFSEKTSFLTVILNSFQDKKAKIIIEDKKELAAFAFEEISKLIELIPTLQTYKEKDEAFGYKDALLGIVMMCYSSPAEIDEMNLNNIKTLMALVDKESFVENAIDNIFKNNQNDKETVNQLLASVIPLKDEFQKGQIYQGLLHYQDGISKLPLDSKMLFADYISSELKRYLDTPLDDTIVNNLEFACDVAKYFINDTIISLLNDILKLEQNNVSFYAVATLLNADQTVPSNVIESLANDIVYANMTYGILKQYGLQSLFPAELSNSEYLAKSDLVHWLTYPTELGKKPDQIEYLGKVKKKEEYYIFRYMSDSDNLEDDRKNQWLIGWSNDEGGTFSDFDLYSVFEKETVEKTLKNIKKRLL
ncbi:MAG: hypothetical protein J6C24_01360 [Clostridia bacterium]|nr:hypothetical protein [Clostridia bacterium]